MNLKVFDWLTFSCNGDPPTFTTTTPIKIIQIHNIVVVCNIKCVNWCLQFNKSRFTAEKSWASLSYVAVTFKHTRFLRFYMCFIILRSLTGWACYDVDLNISFLLLLSLKRHWQRFRKDGRFGKGNAEEFCRSSASRKECGRIWRRISKRNILHFK